MNKLTTKLSIIRFRHLFRIRAVAETMAQEGQLRMCLAIVFFALIFNIVIVRLVLIAVIYEDRSSQFLHKDGIVTARPDILDRRGEVLATDIKAFSIYAEPRRIRNPDEVVEKLSKVFPELNNDSIRGKLATRRGFLWLKREITHEQQRAVHRLGIPGVGFLKENRRFYPGYEIASHILGHVNIDNQGIAGLEQYIDKQGLADLKELGLQIERNLTPVHLSIDLRVQHAVHDEISKALGRYQAIAGIGIVLDVNTGEVIAMTSLPDYNPNKPVQALEKERMNRATAGVFEMGSIFKTFTTAMALDSGNVSIYDRFDASHPIRIGRFTINDFHGKGRVLSVPEIFIFSSNIGTAKMALEAGRESHQSFLERLGLSKRLQTELPESAEPMMPKNWSKISAMTISFGHGISVSPLQTASAAAALVNGGRIIPPTFFVRKQQDAEQLSQQVVTKQTSDMMRYLMRLNVLKGSGRRADVEGYRVGGKTGTAEKVVNGKYSSSHRFNSFLAAFPMDNPQYLVLVIIDEPKPEKPGWSATAARNAAPTVSAIIQRIAPMLGVLPKIESDEDLGIPNYGVSAYVQ